MARVVVNDATILKRFIKDLKDALKKSQRNGGGYSVFLKNNRGEPILQVEIALSIGGHAR